MAPTQITDVVMGNSLPHSWDRLMMDVEACYILCTDVEGSRVTVSSSYMLCGSEARLRTLSFMPNQLLQ